MPRKDTAPCDSLDFRKDNLHQPYIALATKAWMGRGSLEDDVCCNRVSMCRV